MILVTGGTGFIGGHLLTELVKGDVPVKALKRSKSTTKNTEKLFNYKFGSEGKNLFSKINWVEGDIMNIYSIEEAMDGVTEVYHCAAEVSLRDDNPDEIILTAEKGTENMVNASLTKGVKKFCHVSSVASLGMPVNGTEITEECFEEFSYSNSPYHLGKHLAEAEVWRAHAEGLNVVVVCPSIVLGPWNELHKGGSMGFIDFISKNSRFYTEGIMGYVDVKDVVGTMLRLMNENRFNERLIINADNVSFYDLYTYIAKNLGKPLPQSKLGKFALKIFQRINNLGARNKISNTMIDHASSVHIYSNKKIKETLKGYTFTPVKESIEQMAKFYLSEIRK